MIDFELMAIIDLQLHSSNRGVSREGPGGFMQYLIGFEVPNYGVICPLHNFSCNILCFKINALQMIKRSFETRGMCHSAGVNNSEGKLITVPFCLL